MARYALLLVIAFSITYGAADNQAANLVHVEMHNIRYHFSDAISVGITHLEGELEPIAPAQLPIFDDANSFIILVRSAEISLSPDTLAHVLNDYALAAEDAPLKKLRITVRSGKVHIEGKLHSKGDVPFETDGALSVTPEGEIRLHTEKVKAAHLPVKGLMDLLGANISNLISTKKVRGIRADKDDLILTPEQLFPPPHIRGRVTSITVRGNEIIQQYGTQSDPALHIAGNYMAYRGARLRFGKLTMSDTDLTLIDMDPQDPLDFYLEHYKDQLVAGYTKTTPAFGLKSYFRDHDKLRPHQKTSSH